MWVGFNANPLITIMENLDLVEKNIKLVYFVIYHKLKIKDKFEEMCAISAGYDGLLDAAKHFDNNKGFSFSSYAIKCIINKIKRDRMIRYRENNLVLDIDEYCDLESPRNTDSFVDEEYDKFILDRAYKMLSRLNRRDVQIFLKYIDGYNYKRIAEEYGITTQRLYQVVAKIKKKIAIDRLDTRYNE